MKFATTKPLPKIETYKAVCRVCKGGVYYYPAKLLAEDNAFDEPVDMTPKIVFCTCTGEGGAKHTLDYSFPKDFKKI